MISANDFTTGANRKTITPQDVFNAIDEIEYGFMREKLEAEFASMHTHAFLLSTRSIPPKSQITNHCTLETP